jgi:hypothetical protein
MGRVWGLNEAVCRQRAELRQTVGYTQLCVDRVELWVTVGYMKLCVDRELNCG